MTLRRTVVFLAWLSLLGLLSLPASAQQALQAPPAPQTSPDWDSQIWPGWDAEDDEASQSHVYRDRSISHQGFGIRLGFYVHGLLDTENAAPIRYFDLGMRYKHGEYYFDFRLPALFLLLDGLWVLTREFTTDSFTSFPIERLNDFNLMAYWELAHGKMGYRFRTAPPDNWGRPLDIALGVFASAELLILDLRRNLDRNNVYFDDDYDDPLAIIAGGFLSLGDTSADFQYDLSLTLGSAFLGEDGPSERLLLLAGLDADLQYEIGYGAALYLRPRLHTYLTRLSPAFHLSWALSTGLNIRF